MEPENKFSVPSIYIHIPFCRKKCHYCDFLSYAGREDEIDGYVEGLIKEIQSSPPLIPLSIFNGEGETRALAREGVRVFGTIYIGGGTPTLLKPRHFDKILKALTPYNPPLPGGEGDTLCFGSPSPSGRRGQGMRALEITTEANPGTANKAKLKALRQLGINRLSIGAQSFNDHHLKVLGRIHAAKEIFRIYDDARSVGFDNINLDLIFALPHQTLDEWKRDLQTAIDLGPQHLSCYNLEIHESTPLWASLNPHPLSPSPSGRGGIKGGEGSLPSEEEELTMYEYTIETLTAAGYHHYEISNFAKPGFECQHNINYWKNSNYLGVGAGAHSHIDGKRWANADSVEAYIDSGGVLRNVIRLTSNDSHNATDKRETLFMGLRMLEGLPVEKFTGFEKEAAELTADGLLMRENNHYKLTRKGLYLGNLVFEKFV